MTLTRSLNRPLAHGLDRFLNRRLDRRPHRPPDDLAQACSLLDKYIRLRRQTAKAEPHLFGPHASEYYRDTLRQAARDAVVAAALDKIYGPSPPGSPARPSVWQERYSIPPESQKLHRKWFRKKYGS